MRKMHEDRLTLKESAGLLHLIFPNYPDLRGMNATPEIEAFLHRLREEATAGSNQSVAHRTTE
jgi:hypothetical protein